MGSGLLICPIKWSIKPSDWCRRSYHQKSWTKKPQLRSMNRSRLTQIFVTSVQDGMLLLVRVLLALSLTKLIMFCSLIYQAKYTRPSYFSRHNETAAIIDISKHQLYSFYPKYSSK